jgi:NAD-reducing hydrogenase small subunit
MSFLDLDERLIELAGLADVVYSPVVDAKEFPENVDITLVEGAIANEDNLREIHRIRKHSKILVAFGDCAVTGNVTALRNLFRVDDVLNRSYKENSAVISGLPLGGDGIVPKLLDRVRRVQDVVHVDHFLPGCPPSADAIFSFVTELLAGQQPTGGRKFGS